MTTCASCGATYSVSGDDCNARFDALLALDHSRSEPWGSRHGLAFSAFALQHPDRYDPDVLQRAWLFLNAVYIRGSDRADVARALRRGGRETPQWDVPPLPAERPRGSFDLTIADLGSFAADAYAANLDRWCRATVSGWSVRAGS